MRASLAPPRSASRAERTAVWVDTAMDLLIEGGLEAVTVKGLARRLGRSVGALYRYFPGKDALLASMQEAVLRELLQELQGPPALPDPGARALASVVHLARVYGTLQSRRPARYALLASLMADPRTVLPDEEAGRVAIALVPLLAEAAARLDAAVAAGALEPGDAGERTMILWSALHGLGQLPKMRRLIPDASLPTPDAVAAALLRGWGADAAALRAALAPLGGPP